MKKYYGALTVVLVAVLMLTGCGANENVLRCTGEEMGADISVEARFRNDQLRRVEMVTTYDFSALGVEGEMLDQMREILDASCEMFDEEGFTCRTDVSGNYAKMFLTIDVDADSEEALEHLGLEEDELTYAAVREFWEDSGFVCQ